MLPALRLHGPFQVDQQLAITLRGKGRIHLDIAFNGTLCSR